MLFHQGHLLHVFSSHHLQRTEPSVLCGWPLPRWSLRPLKVSIIHLWVNQLEVGRSVRVVICGDVMLRGFSDLLDTVGHRRVKAPRTFVSSFLKHRFAVKSCSLCFSSPPRVKNVRQRADWASRPLEPQIDFTNTRAPCGTLVFLPPESFSSISSDWRRATGLSVGTSSQLGMS